MLWAGTTSPHETMEQTRLTHVFVREPAMGWIRHRETLLLWYLEWCSHGGVSKYSQLAYLWQPTLWLQVWWWKSRNDSFWAPRLTYAPTAVFYQCSWGSRVFRCWLLIFEIVLSSRWDHIWCLSHAPSPRWSCSYFLYTYSRFWWFFLPILIIFPCCLLSVLVACPCCLFFLPVLFPYPLSMPSSLSFLVFPLVSFTFLLGFVALYDVLLEVRRIRMKVWRYSMKHGYFHLNRSGKFRWFTPPCTHEDTYWIWARIVSRDVTISGRVCGIIRCTVGSTTHMREGLMIFDETWLLSFE